MPVPPTPIKLLRLERGLRLCEIEQQTGINRKRIYRLERGIVRRPQYSVITALAEIYGVDRDELYRQVCDAA